MSLLAAPHHRAPHARIALVATLLLTLAGAAPAHADTTPEFARRAAAERIERALEPERLDQPPATPAELWVPQGPAKPSSVITFGRFSHVQVNVNGVGSDIVGDAANEPSIAIDPTNHNHMVIGWRQFGNVTSNFREAGYAYTTNGGGTWSAGRIQAGTFRSDPVLGTDASGKFFYNSLTTSPTITSQVFPSTNGGITWGTSVFSYGGDKQWMTIDRNPFSAGLGHFYQAWSTASNSYAPNTFNRSVDDGGVWQSPSFMASESVWGTLDTARDGTLYVVGTDLESVYVSRSFDARFVPGPPTFSTRSVNLNGTITTGGPNPAGLCGQLWIAVDRSGGPRDGWVYVMGSIATPTDPLDVMFSRSTDGGSTWSAPVRVNDDPASSKAWQWFATMSLSPNGRLDAVWNDSRVSGDSTKTALEYAFSDDGGVTWSANEQASPVWDASVGYPNQSKIGDYYTMISDVDGADLAWTATFNGGEDVYYTRIPRQTTAVPDRVPGPAALHPAAPNPFSYATAIRYDVPGAGATVRLEVFDAAGQRVATLANGVMPGGTQVAHWDGLDTAGRRATSGIYFCRYQAAGRSETRKLMLLR